MRRQWQCVVVAPLVVLLSACTSSSIGSSVGVVSGVAGSALTANPAVGYAVGISLKAATDATIKYIFREWTHEQQSLMANIAGELPIGQEHAWEVSRVIPYGNERGRLQVVREIDNALLRCRELLFTVEIEQDLVNPYMTSICYYQGQWQWASADPAVQRWQGLQ